MSDINAPDSTRIPVVQATACTAEFTITINDIRTTSINGLDDAVKEVSWTLTGTEGGQTFDLPQNTVLGDPDPDNFLLLQNLTQELVTSWVEADVSKLNSVKAHIQYVLTKQIATASLTTVRKPWAPDEPVSSETPVTASPAVTS